MEADRILDFNNTTTEDLPVTETDASTLLQLIAESEEVAFELLELVYVDSTEIVRINREHLGRDYVTDIITFNYQDADEPLEGTLYCCEGRIREQAEEYDQDIRQEFLRIIIHGLLHLCGYEDNSASEKDEMTRKEDHYLSLFNRL